MEEKNMPKSDIHWYPGHMTKAKRMMQENLPLIDLVIEIVDARVPLSSKNPDIDALAKNKYRMIILNKVDLADERKTALWEEYYREKGFTVLRVNSKAGDGMKSISAKVREVCKEKIERNKKKGILNRPIRAMIVGIPNVGKSTFINSYAKRAVAKTGNKPGVTKGKQWIKANNELELLDTPGILWPKFEDRIVGRNLAMIGSINDEILSLEDLTYETIQFMMEAYPDSFRDRYELVASEYEKPIDLYEAICRKRGCIKKGDELDYGKGATVLLDDFRSGRLGKITLEVPKEKQ